MCITFSSMNVTLLAVQVSYLAMQKRFHAKYEMHFAKYVPVSCFEKGRLTKQKRHATYQ